MDKLETIKFDLSAIELEINETVMDIAKNQAALPPESDFHITHDHFANLLKRFLEGTDFIGVSVSIIIMLISIILTQTIYNRVQSTLIKMEYVTQLD